MDLHTTLTYKLRDFELLKPSRPTGRLRKLKYHDYDVTSSDLKVPRWYIISRGSCHFPETIINENMQSNPLTRGGVFSRSALYC